MAFVTLELDVTYDARKTNPEAVADALDQLLETALSTEGVLDVLGEIDVGSFLVPDAEDEEDDGPGSSDFVRIKARDLRIGDRVDLLSCRFCDVQQHPIVESEWSEVAEINPETSSCLAVTFAGVDRIGLPPDEELTIRKREGPRRDQYDNPIPDDLVLMPPFGLLDKDEVQKVYQADWYEAEHPQVGKALLVSSKAIGGYETSLEDATGIKADYCEICHIAQTLHRYNSIDGFYHA